MACGGRSENPVFKNSPAVDRALAALDRVGKMLVAKNLAYGDSIAHPLQLFSKATPEEGIRLHIDEKIKRLVLGDGSGNEDAIGDLIGYLALLAGEREQAEGGR
jgi:hypothetical protein